MTSPRGFTRNNSNPCRVNFARRFRRSLMEIKSRQINNSNFPPSFGEIRKRSHRIKIAAYSSMAYAVGPRKAWTRALLLRLHNRAKRHRFTRKRSLLLDVKKKTKKTKKIRVSKVLNNQANRCKPAEDRENDDDDVISNEQTEKLRHLVPGGKAMDICSLFEQTAHFIKCLAMQVQVMQDIADQLSR